jgi:hypothetical protein
MPKDPWAQMLLEVQTIASDSAEVTETYQCFNISENYPGSSDVILCSIESEDIDDDESLSPKPRRSPRDSSRPTRMEMASAKEMIDEELRQHLAEEKRMCKVLRKQQQADGDRSKLRTKADKALTRKEQQEDVAKSKLEQYNHLVNRFVYISGTQSDEEGKGESKESKEESSSVKLGLYLYLIINTFRSKTKDRFMATAARHRESGDDNLHLDTDLITLPIIGEAGALALVEAYEERLSIPKGMIFPKSDTEWKKVQEEEWTEEWEHVTGERSEIDFHEIADAADGGCNQTNRNGSIKAQN